MSANQICCVSRLLPNLYPKDFFRKPIFFSNSICFFQNVSQCNFFYKTDFFQVNLYFIQKNWVGKHFGNKKITKNKLSSKKDWFAERYINIYLWHINLSLFENVHVSSILALSDHFDFCLIMLSLHCINNLIIILF